MNLDKFKGVFCALNAIYDENDNVDLEKMKALVRVYNPLALRAFMLAAQQVRDFYFQLRRESRSQERLKKRQAMILPLLFMLAVPQLKKV